jgi:hypothetical protein
MIDSGLSILSNLVMICLFVSSLGSGESEMKEKEVVLRGNVVCVDETGFDISCQYEDRFFALKVEDGTRFIFLPEDPSSRMFEDDRFHHRELQVRAWNRGSNRLEIIKVFSVKDDRLFDVYYFCQTCNIKAFVGGLCWCCQDEFEFREIPVQRD